MADPLLTSLCGICHIAAPKYKCPRCGLRTCSLPCIKKHKAWSECSGARDPTTYLPRSKLRTPAGIDHDYNFLHSIERSAESAERLLVHERSLVQEGELRPLTVQEVRWKVGRDGRRRKVLVTRALREAKGRTLERFLAARLKKLNTRILCAPTGMARQKENNTTLNRRTGRINWQVEWLAFDGAEHDIAGGPCRLLSKVMDDVPLYVAYSTALEDNESKTDGSQQRRTGIKHVEMAQRPSDSTWNACSGTLQDACSQTWVVHSGADISGLWPSQVDAERRQRSQFYLGRGRTRSDLPDTVTPLEPTDCLREVLRDTQVLEYPTIYVQRSGEPLPAGFVLGPKDPHTPTTAQGTKRKGQPERGRGGGRGGGGGKRRNMGGGKHLEEGEVDSDNEGRDEDQDQAVGGLEAGEVLAEESFGEEEDDGGKEDTDDSTSSSGSDGD